MWSLFGLFVWKLSVWILYCTGGWVRLRVTGWHFTGIPQSSRPISTLMRVFILNHLAASSYLVRDIVSSHGVFLYIFLFEGEASFFVFTSNTIFPANLFLSWCPFTFYMSLHEQAIYTKHEHVNHIFDNDSERNNISSHNNCTETPIILINVQRIPKNGSR